MLGQVDPKEFWENKILVWEESRYAQKSGDVTEKIAGAASSSLRFRVQAAVELLAPFVAGRKVVELGCGSGFLAESLIAKGAIDYRGIDISERAIDAARQRIAGSASASKITFEALPVDKLTDLGDAIVFSLGLFDWLTPEEIDKVFEVGKHGSFLHAVAERRPGSIIQAIHKLYVYFSYGHRTGGYVPQYHTFRQIEAAAERVGFKNIRPYRDDRMRFGIFVTDLPVSAARLP